MSNTTLDHEIQIQEEIVTYLDHKYHEGWMVNCTSPEAMAEYVKDNMDKYDDSRRVNQALELLGEDGFLECVTDFFNEVQSA